MGGTERVGDVVRGKRQEAGKGQRAKGRLGRGTGGMRRWERSGLVLASNQRTRVLVIKAGRWQMAVGSGSLLAVAGTWICRQL